MKIKREVKKIFMRLRMYNMQIGQTRQLRVKVSCLFLLVLGHELGDEDALARMVKPSVTTLFTCLLF